MTPPLQRTPGGWLEVLREVVKCSRAVRPQRPRGAGATLGEVEHDFG